MLMAPGTDYKYLARKDTGSQREPSSSLAPLPGILKQLDPGGWTLGLQTDVARVPVMARKCDIC